MLKRKLELGQHLGVISVLRGHIRERPAMAAWGGKWNEKEQVNRIQHLGGGLRE